MIGEAALHFVAHFAGQAVAGIVHGQHHAQQVQPGIEPLFDQLEGLQQFDDAFQGEKFALQGDEQFLRGAEGVEGQQAQGRRAVDDDVIVLRAQRFEAVTQVELAGHLVHQFQFHGHQVGAGGQHVKEGRAGAADALVDVLRRVEGGVEVVVQVFLGDTDTAGAVGLGVTVHQQHALFHDGQCGGKVDGGGRLADAAFLVGYGNDARHAVLRAVFHGKQEELFHGKQTKRVAPLPGPPSAEQNKEKPGKWEDMNRP